MNTSAVIEELKKMHACPAAIVWMEANSTLSPRELWVVCPRPDWLMWLLVSKSAENNGWPPLVEILMVLCDIVELHGLPIAKRKDPDVLNGLRIVRECIDKDDVGMSAKDLKTILNDPSKGCTGISSLRSLVRTVGVSTASASDYMASLASTTVNYTSLEFASARGVELALIDVEIADYIRLSFQVPL